MIDKTDELMDVLITALSFEDAVSVAEKLIADGWTQQKWIPASEPPKKDGEYFVHRKGFRANYREALWYSKKLGWHYCDSEYGNVKVMGVTHWMPLPEPPKETVKPTEEPVRCKDCEYLEISGCYGECGKAYKGIVQPNDSCGKGVRAKPKEEDV